jgi:ribosome-binding factor A
VDVSEDCRSAKVYFSVAGTLEERERSMKGLDSAKGYVRRELGRRIRLRYTPEIMFRFDPSIEYAIHIGEVIQQLKQEVEKNGDSD